ncbi:MAG: N-acetylmuramoyl-L-alanine amidase [Clostridia bacterium]|nr:N-acetylmuramoyl-L-alanine amidase [Clostridia bacterium]
MKQLFRLAVWDVAIVLTCAAIVLTVSFGHTDRRFAQAQRNAATRIVIDAGHGGADGGAEAADGTLEKTINLAVAQPLGDLLQIMGYAVTYTRIDDTMIHTEGDTLRERKVSDMRNRLALVETADLTVSIHQNKFPQTQYSGTQVFYGVGHETSRTVAAAIREEVVSLLQPHNTRELKKGDSNIYLLSKATRPIVLVECGFLSNPSELANLKTETYRCRLAFAIAGGVLKGR